MENPYLVYMTMATLEEADRIGEMLVSERLAACVNILGEVQSKFWWEGKVQSEREVAMTAKTSPRQLDSLVARVHELHSYDCPCVVALPSLVGIPRFSNGSETRHREPQSPSAPSCQAKVSVFRCQP